MTAGDWRESSAVSLGAISPTQVNRFKVTNLVALLFTFVEL